jgi:hypothetical protein
MSLSHIINSYFMGIIYIWLFKCKDGINFSTILILIFHLIQVRTLIFLIQTIINITLLLIDA